jgi:hypothetical protein
MFDPLIIEVDRGGVPVRETGCGFDEVTEMSEYQYYEFQTVDRPLTPQEMADLRAISTRATITPTQFQNVYSYGDLKAEPID